MNQPVDEIKYLSAMEIEHFAKCAEGFPVSVLLREEMSARGWDSVTVARRMGGDFDTALCVLEMTLYVDDPDIVLDELSAAGFARAFGTSVGLWLRNDEAWRVWKRAHPGKPVVLGDEGTA